MVCLGNICRSPLADEGILKSKLPKNKFLIDSAGTANYHIGSTPGTRSIMVANKHGINISTLKGRQFIKDDSKVFDFIYVMDQSNYNNTIALAKNDSEKSKVKLILNETHPSKNFEIPDPHYGGDHGFENVYQILNEACSIIAASLN